MNISEFVSKPTPRKLTVDSESIIAEYGEALDFYIMLPMPIECYAKLTALSKAEFVKEMLVTEAGQRLIPEDQSIEGAFISEVNDKIWIELGKLPGRNKPTVI